MRKYLAGWSCRPKRPAGAHDRLKSLLTIPRNTCSRSSEIRALDPLKRAAIGFEHLHRAAGNAVGLAAEQRAGLLLDDAGLDVGKGGQLRRQGQTGRPAADDEDVNLLRNGAGRS